MAECPRNIRFTHGKRRYEVEYHCEPADPASKCSNPECEDAGAFAVSIVVHRIIIRSADVPGETFVDQSHPQWAGIVAIAKVRLGHGQTHCQTASSRFCEAAMNRQNYVATLLTFHTKIGGTKAWDDLADRLQRKRDRKRGRRQRKAYRN